MKAPPQIVVAVLALAALSVLLIAGGTVFLNMQKQLSGAAEKYSASHLRTAGVGSASAWNSPEICQKYDVLGLYDRAEADFARYKDGLSAEQAAQYNSFCETVQHSCFMVIILNGNLYVRHFFPGYQSRHRSTLHQLYRLSVRFHPLPDAAFVIDVSDGIIQINNLPIFVITRGRQMRAGILYPDFTFYNWPEASCKDERTHAYTYLYESFARDAKRAAANPRRAFNDKQDMLFWRGGMVGNPDRQRAVANLQNVMGIDVQFMQWHNTSITGYNGAPGCVGLLDHCRYKYLAFLNGNSYSSRLKYELLCGSCVFASAQSWVEWWSHLFVAGVDWVEVQPDFSDAPLKLAQVRSSEDKGFSYAEKARKKALALLSDDAVDCYWKYIIEQAAAILPTPSVSDLERWPFTKPIEDVLLYGNDAWITDKGLLGPVVQVR